MSRDKGFVGKTIRFTKSLFSKEEKESPKIKKGYRNLDEVSTVSQVDQMTMVLNDENAHTSIKHNLEETVTDLEKTAVHFDKSTSKQTGVLDLSQEIRFSGRFGGEYKITDYLGSGAMGDVYLAKKVLEEGLGREIVVKIPKEDETALSCFDRERIALSAIRDSRDDSFKWMVPRNAHIKPKIGQFNHYQIKEAMKEFIERFDTEGLTDDERKQFALRFKHGEVIESKYTEKNPGYKYVIGFFGASNGGETREIPKLLDKHQFIGIQKLSPNLYTLLNENEDIKVTDTFVGRKQDPNTNKPIDVVTAYKIFKEALQGIIYLADQSVNVLHNDLKPDNIMCNTFGENQLIATSSGEFNTMLSDFGSAYHRYKRSNEKVITGTPAYMSLDLFRNLMDWMVGEKGSVDFRKRAKGNVYSLGCTLYEMITGIHPRFGMTEKEILNMAFDKEHDYAPFDISKIDDIEINYVKLNEASESEESVAQIKQELKELITYLTPHNLDDMTLPESILKSLDSKYPVLDSAKLRPKFYNPRFKFDF